MHGTEGDSWVAVTSSGGDSWLLPGSGSLSGSPSASPIPEATPDVSDVDAAESEPVAVGSQMSEAPSLRMGEAMTLSDISLSDIPADCLYGLFPFDL